MAYNLRKGKAKGKKGTITNYLAETSTNMSGDTGEIHSKLDRLLEGKAETDKKLSQILEKLSKTEQDIVTLKTKQGELEDSTQFLSNEIDKLNERLLSGNPGSVTHTTELEKRIHPFEEWPTSVEARVPSGRRRMGTGLVSISKSKWRRSELFLWQGAILFQQYQPCHFPGP